MKQYLFDKLPEGPFTKIRGLIAGITPKMSIIDMSIGEPKHGIPDFVAPILNQQMAGFGKYPAALGIDELRNANANWLNQRFGLNGKADKDKHITVLNGTREGLFNATLLALDTKKTNKPIVAMPDPFYQVYAAGGLAAQAELLFLPCAKSSGFLPDITTIKAEQWQRMCAFFICSPSNPQGAFADATYFAMLIAMARKYDFYIFSDECYSEIYADDPPISALDIAAQNGDFENVISFFSLSKRSSLPGLRSGFCAGDAGFTKRFKAMRNIAAPQVPAPLQHVAVKAWSEESHVVQNRKLYNQKFDIADKIIGTMFDYKRPQGGFFLWLNMAQYGGGEICAQQIWQHCGIKSLPGGYLSVLASQNDAAETAKDYLRLALVGSLEDTTEALTRLVNYYTNLGANNE
ncbi:MAG: aminotransferase class I/II-fold pyridoxal phosphate-dependent enzyme [Rhizobiales bacterium]|nr:aminotransferase class I/II-fold pyridoxal phosphate-dependent enzyme [Hyphomicrobiales bacterium]NRB14240.1 aminotransferase class I/II-fold pyridoxal phosphate-dependent enzyme [Hyphomicrobiales bacterium]